MATVERERRFLVHRVPEALDGGEPIRQGYLARNGTTAVRVRSIGPARRLTIKSGSGTVRTEVELAMTEDEFDALWPLTAGHRIDKVRHRVTLGDLVAEVDQFHGDLDGRWLVEVEFPDDHSAASFVPPPWFGSEVTDDPAFTNVSLAEHGWPEPTAPGGS